MLPNYARKCPFDDQSESNPNILLVGTIKGIFRSGPENVVPLPNGAAAAAAQMRGENEVDVESSIDPRNLTQITRERGGCPTRALTADKHGKLSRRE
jgi:hypothetical protein